jgi:hypothetical protein
VVHETFSYSPTTLSQYKKLDVLLLRLIVLATRGREHALFQCSTSILFRNESFSLCRTQRLCQLPGNEDTVTCWQLSALAPRSHAGEYFVRILQDGSVHHAFADFLVWCTEDAVRYLLHHAAITDTSCTFPVSYAAPWHLFFPR